MIRHVLLVKVAADAVPAVEAAFEQIGRVAERLPGVLSFASGPSNSPERLERGYTHGMIVDFVDPQALHGYAVDAEHVAAGALITEAAVGGRDGLLVVDLELPQPAGDPATSGTQAVTPQSSPKITVVSVLER